MFFFIYPGWFAQGGAANTFTGKWHKCRDTYWDEATQSMSIAQADVQYAYVDIAYDSAQELEA